MENNVPNEISRVETNISDEIMAEMFLDEAMKDFKKGRIIEEIDQSLKNRDRETFLRLAEELKSVS